MIDHPILSMLARNGMKLGLERVKSLLAHLGEPQRLYPVVHIAGTNGKGSVSAMVTGALVAAGYRVGTYLSPHLEHVNERVRIDWAPIDDASLLEAIEALDRERHDWSLGQRLEGSPLTYFEFMTLLAFLHFARQAVNVAVVEVGLGGRLDSTNVVNPVVCAITSIGFDHVAELGDTLEKIALEKAGILVAGVPVVLGGMPEPAWKTIEARAAGLRCPVWRPGRDLMRETRKTGWFLKTPAGSMADMKLAMDGAHQGGNANVALAVLHQLRGQGFLIPDEAIRKGFAETRIEGRLETLRPGLIIDGAHNEDGTKVLAAWLATRPRPGKRILVFGMNTGRDPTKILAPLLPHFDEVVTAKCAHPHARDPLELAAILREHFEIELSAGDSLEEVLPEVYGEADETIVSGSLYLCGAARSVVRTGILDRMKPGERRSIIGDAEEA